MSLRYDTGAIEFTQNFWEECVRCGKNVRDDGGDWCVNCGQWICDDCWDIHEERCLRAQH